MTGLFLTGFATTFILSIGAEELFMIQIKKQIINMRGNSFYAKDKENQP